MKLALLAVPFFFYKYLFHTFHFLTCDYCVAVFSEKISYFRLNPHICKDYRISDISVKTWCIGNYIPLNLRPWPFDWFVIEFVFFRPSSFHGIIRPNFRYLFQFYCSYFNIFSIFFYLSSLDLKKSFFWLLDLRLKSVRCFSEEFDLLSNDFCLLTILGFWSILDMWIILGSTWTSDSWFAIYSSLHNKKYSNWIN